MLSSPRPGIAVPPCVLLAFVLLLTATSCGKGDPEPESPGAAPPNVLLLVVDTLRADRLDFYGHHRETSPEMRTRLAEKGAVVEHAYAQAPWTLPSMASLLTGLDPAVFLDDDGKPWGLPEGAQTLAEILKASGYNTYGFVANPTLHDGNGFAQGFDHFETAPYDPASLRRHAHDLDAQVRPHLDSLEAPYFLYVHYLDPHDPYENPDLVDGRSPFFPDYRGALRGTDVHGLYLRKLEMADPEQDVKHLRALYDSEIRYVDRYVGKLLETLDLRNTLVVFTSDHGEELYEHGGWKHGESVYEEQIRVPLVFRWDGRIAAGRRLDGTARLLDVVPTVLEAAGVSTSDPLDGRSLWPALAGEETLPREPVFSRHHADGPLRMARVDGRQKTVLFDREASVRGEETERIRTFRKLDRERMERLEVYDLSADPGEQNPHRGEPGTGKEVLAGLDPFLEGLRIFVTGTECESVSGRLRSTRPPSGVEGWFLGPRDRVTVDGADVHFVFFADGVDKGITVKGSLGEILEFETDGCASVRWAGKEPPTLPAGLRSALIETLPLTSQRDESRLHLWIREPRRTLGDGARDEETLRRLKALGYTD